MIDTIRAAALAALAMLLACAGGAAAQDRIVTVQSGQATLQGSLLLQDGARPGPAVLFISGSGPTDRDGNSTVPGVRPSNMKQLADGLADGGIASLRYDKRGVGKSTPGVASEGDVTFLTFVDDVVAWAKFLKAQPGVSCIVLAGHSEGALLATLAARKVDVCGLVLIAGTGRHIDEVLSEQLAAGAMPDDLRQKASAILTELRAGRRVADVPAPLMVVFRPSIQPYMISWLPIDPAVELAKVRAPVLIVQGETDLQVRVEDARLLAKARPDARLLVLDGVNHVLKRASLDRAANIAAYADPMLPVDPRIVPAIVDFVKSKAR